MKNTTHSKQTAGIDTGKDTLVLAVDGSPDRLEVANDAAGHERAALWLAERHVTRIGIEASGGYEKAVTAVLRQAGFKVIVFQPKQVRCLAGFELLRAKNDPIDAALIARCAASCQDIRPAPDPRLEDFAAYLTWIDQLSEDIARWKTRLESCRRDEQRAWIGEEIKRLTRTRNQERMRLVRSLKTHRDLARRLSLILSVPGIGIPTALALVIRLPELGRVTREQIASLAGLAPFDHDSGRFRGQRRIAGGRGKVRKALYAATFPATQRWNPQLVAVYKRLRQAGKKHKPALIACARKLLIMVNAVLARGTPWVTENPTT